MTSAAVALPKPLVRMSPASALPSVQPYRARRANCISMGERLSCAVFGSPSVRRANGGAEASLVPNALRTHAWYARRRQTPIFEIDRKGSEGSERLPRIWVTEPAFDVRTGAVVGREFVGVYPCDPDRGGRRALEMAERYYGEALGYEGDRSEAGSDGHLARVECFRAAEILYLHAAWRGSVEACVRLAAIYQEDRCEGLYWKGMLEHRARHAAEVPLEERAFAWCAQAAAQGHAEACWRMGDLLVQGRGCAVDYARSYALYRRAYDAAADGRAADGRASRSAEARHAGGSSYRAGACVDVACAGQAAVRLARCHELGRGCAQSFERAHSWYRIAAELLGEAYDQGSWRCKRALAEAQRGERRMTQEICGLY